MAKPVFRTYREGDEVAINRLFEEASGVVRSLDEWSWLYPPEADGRVIVVAETGGEVVAHCAGTPLRVAVDERELAAARIDDLLSPAPGNEIAEQVVETFFDNFAFSGRFSLVVACRRSPDDAGFPLDLPGWDLPDHASAPDRPVRKLWPDSGGARAALQIAGGPLRCPGRVGKGWDDGDPQGLCQPAG